MEVRGHLTAHRLIEPFSNRDRQVICVRESGEFVAAESLQLCCLLGQLSGEGPSKHRFEGIKKRQAPLIDARFQLRKTRAVKVCCLGFRYAELTRVVSLGQQVRLCLDGSYQRRNSMIEACRRVICIDEPLYQLAQL